MNMFGVGPVELLVVLAVALIFVGPERLPRLAADIAKMIREVRKYTGSLAAEFNQVVKELEEETKPDVAQWKEIGEGLSDATKGVASELNAAQADASAALTPPADAKRNPADVFTPPPPAASSTNGTTQNGAGRPAEAAEKPR
jgi:sec-independent protein translocase protein TatB